MANVKSAEKRNRQNKKKNEVNKMARSAMRSAIKALKDAVSAGKSDEQILRTAQKVVAQTARKGVIHKRTASRYISRLTNLSKKATSSASK
jgi:small subunit ribosomal protein S20